MVSPNDKVPTWPWDSRLVGAEILPVRIERIASFDNFDFSTRPDADIKGAALIRELPPEPCHFAEMVGLPRTSPPHSTACERKFTTPQGVRCR